MSSLLKNTIKQLLALTLGLALITGSMATAGAAPVLLTEPAGNSATEMQGLTALTLLADNGTAVSMVLMDSSGNAIDSANPLELADMEGDVLAKISITLADGIKLNPDGSTTLTLNLPDELRVKSAADAVPGEITGSVNGSPPKKIATLSKTGSSITLDFEDDFLGANNRNCHFEAKLDFVPKLDPTPPVSPAVMTGGGISGLNPAPPLQVSELPFVPDYTAPKLEKTVTLDKVTGLYKVVYKLSTGNELLYNNTTTLPLTDELDYLLLVPDSVYFNGAKLNDGTDYTYTAAASGYTGNKLVATLPLTGLARNTDYYFTYDAKLDNRLFSDSSIDKVNLRCESKPAAIGYKKADGTNGSFSTTPALWERKDYKPSLIDVELSVVAGTNGRILQWDATINTPGITMKNSQFSINYLNGKQGGQYLTLLENSTHYVQYLKSASGGTEVWEPMTSMGSGGGTGNGDLAFAYTGWGDLTAQRKVRFFTQVSEDYFKHNYETYNFKVGVGMNWTSDSGKQMGTNWENVLEQPIGTQSLVLKKQLVSYDKATGIASWKLTLNERQVDLGNDAITITDTLKNGDSYITGSAGISSVTPSGTPTPSFRVVTAANDTVTMELTDVGTHTVTIGLQTKVAPGRFYTNGEIGVDNSATATGGNINPDTPYTVNSKNKETNNVLTKTKQTDYKAETREIVWKLVVNADKKPMYDAVLTDMVTEAGIGHELEDVTLYSDAACLNATGMTFSKVTADPVDGKYTYTLDLDDSADGTAVELYYKTKATKSAAYNQVENILVTNEAALSYNYENEDGASPKKGNATSKATDNVPFAVVTKKMYRDGTNKELGNNDAVSDYVRNVIVVNPEHLELVDAYIDDSMTFGGSADTPFAIDAAGMQITAFDKDGTPGQSVRVTVQDTAPAAGSLEASLVRSSFVPNQGFRLLLPSKTDYRYEITYNAKITDRTVTSGKKLVNSVTYYNGNVKKAAIAASGDMRVASAGGSATNDPLTNGRLVLRATETGSADSSYNGRPVPDARYALYDSLGLLVAEGVTDSNGEVIFEGLTSGVRYQLAELLPALGYRSSTIFADDDPAGALAQKVYRIDNLPAKDSTPGKQGLVVPVTSVYLTVDTLPLTKKNQAGDSSTAPVTFTVTRRSDNTVVATATTTPGSGQPLTLNKPLRFATDDYTLTESATGYKPVTLELTMSDNRTNGTAVPYDTTTLTLTKAAGSGGTLTQDAAGLYTLTNELVIPPAPPSSSPDRAPENPGKAVWGGLEKTLSGAQAGQTVTVEAGDLTSIPADLLNSIAGKDITLVIYRNGGNPIVINGLRFTPEPGRLYYTLADLLLRYLNPETGGYGEQTEQLLAALETLRTAEGGTAPLLGPAPDSVRVLDSNLQPVTTAQSGAPLLPAIGVALLLLAALLLTVHLLTKRSLKI